MYDKAFFDRYHYSKIQLELPQKWEQAIVAKNWEMLDSYTGDVTAPGGVVYTALTPFRKFQSIERILSIRCEPDDEDGIWHDDGSRLMAFTLSLIKMPSSIKGGELLYREKSKQNKIFSIPPQKYGTLLVFKTGVEGFEHKVQKVTKGMRIICAGWCS